MLIWSPGRGNYFFGFPPVAAVDFRGAGMGLGERSVRSGACSRACLDWSERRPHLAGALGAAVAERAFANGWVRRTKRSREVSVTQRGEAELERHFGISVLSRD